MFQLSVVVKLRQFVGVCSLILCCLVNEVVNELNVMNYATDVE